MVRVLQLASHKNMVREKDLQEELRGEDMGQSYRGAQRNATADDKVFGKDKDVD